jgi:hypothetical protein
MTKPTLPPSPRMGFTTLASVLVALLDRGMTCSPEDAVQHVSRGDVLLWLDGLDITDVSYHLSLYRIGDDEERTASESAISEAFEGQIYAHTYEEMGGDHNGYALLLAYCLEVIREQLVYAGIQ